MTGESGSEPLRKANHERFAALLAEGGLTQVQAYCQSVTPHLEPTPGRVVSASRLANAEPVQHRVAFLRRERAEARAAEAAPVTRESIHALLDEVTSALLDASKAAGAAGADGLRQQLNRVILTHAGRSHRAHARAPLDKEDRPSFDSESALSALKWCDCDA